MEGDHSPSFARVVLSGRRFLSTIFTIEKGNGRKRERFCGKGQKNPRSCWFEPLALEIPEVNSAAELSHCSQFLRGKLALVFKLDGYVD